MEFSTGAILAIIAGCAALIPALVPLLKTIFERVEQKRQERIKIKELENSNIQNLRQLEAEREEHEREEAREARDVELEFYKRRCEECQKELAEAENNSLLSRPKRRQVNTLLLKISRNIYAMEKGFEEKYHVIGLNAIFQALKKQFEELEELMP